MRELQLGLEAGGSGRSDARAWIATEGGIEEQNVDERGWGFAGILVRSGQVLPGQRPWSDAAGLVARDHAVAHDLNTSRFGAVGRQKVLQTPKGFVIRGHALHGIHFHVKPGVGSRLDEEQIGLPEVRTGDRVD